MRKKVVLLIIIIMLTATAVFTVFSNISILGRKYIDKDEIITAAEIDVNKIFTLSDSENVFNVKLKEMTQYFEQNDINTAVVLFNSGKAAIADVGVLYNDFPTAEYIDGDILKAIKRPLEKSGVQLIVELDCSGLSEYEILHTVHQICSEYAVAGIVISNLEADYSVMSDIADAMSAIFKNYWLGIKTDNLETAANVPENTADMYIVDNITESQYRNAKQNEFGDKTVLLNYTSSSFLSDLFILSNFGDYDGAVVTEYTVPDTDLSLVKSITDTSYPLDPFDFKIDTEFAVTSPAADTQTYSKGIFVTGVGNPEIPVYINGNLVDSAKDGTFGYYLELTEGDNLIQIVQGENTAARTVTKKVYSGSGNDKKQYDETKKAKAGQIVQTFNDLTSILANPDDDSSIIDGVQKNVQMVVQETVRTQRSGEYTYAYKLSNGGYILAKNVEWVEENQYTESRLENIYLEKLEEGNEYLVLQLTGKPAVISHFDETAVTFTLLDTAMSQQFYKEDEEGYSYNISSVFADNCVLKQDGNNTVITIENTGETLWGYNTEYNDGNIVKIYLKKSPHKVRGAKPLTGVSIVLDAGHGGNDPGALAVGGINGPNEKDINLALTLATKQCLEKLGATVTLTRQDDTYLTLQQRRDITNTVKPDLFIAIHHNSLEYTVDASNAKGFESYYFSNQSKAVAEIMSDKISASAERNNRGYHYGYYYVLRNDIAPCVLNEYGFINNPYEYATLHDDIDIYKAAIGTSLAVLDVIPE